MALIEPCEHGLKLGEGVCVDCWRMELGRLRAQLAAANARIERLDVELEKSDREVSALSNISEALRSSLHAANARADEAERRIKHQTYYQVHNTALAGLRKRYEAALDEHSDSPLAATVQDALMDLDQLTAELAAVRAVVADLVDEATREHAFEDQGGETLIARARKAVEQT